MGLKLKLFLYTCRSLLCSKSYFVIGGGKNISLSLSRKLFLIVYHDVSVFLRNDSVLLRSLAGVRDWHAEDGPDRRHGGSVLHHRHPPRVRHTRPQLLGHSGNVVHPYCTAYLLHTTILELPVQNDL